jgi:hypothetical protein
MKASLFVYPNQHADEGFVAYLNIGGAKLYLNRRDSDLAANYLPLEVPHPQYLEGGGKERIEVELDPLELRVVLAETKAVRAIRMPQPVYELLRGHNVAVLNPEKFVGLQLEPEDVPNELIQAGKAVPVQNGQRFQIVSN